MDKSRHDRAGVGSRLKQRLALMLLHSSCAATTSSTAFVGLASGTTINAAVTAPALRQEPPPPPRARRGPREPRPSKAVGGDDGSRSCQCRHQHQHQHHHRRRGARALVHISIDCSARSSVGAAALPPPATARVKGGGGSRSRLPRSSSYGWSCGSSSSASATDSDGEAAPFSSEGADARSSTLFSSRSFSSDSTSDFYGTRPRRRKKPLPPAPRRAPTRPAAGAFPGRKGERRSSLNGGRDGGGDMEEAAAGSTAVVKRSRNPYADFRRSMVEMVAGRRIRGADALSELLVWYLSLNSPRHHPAILAAFEDVWEAVLGTDP